MKAEGKWLVIIIVVCLIVGGVIGWFTYSAFTEKPKNIVSSKTNTNVQDKEIKLDIKDSGEVAVEIFRWKQKRDTTQVSDSTVKPERPDTTIYNDTLRATNQIATDSLEYKGKKYPIKYSVEVPHKVIVTDSGSTWEAKALIKLILPVIYEAVATDSVKVIEKPVFVPKPFFLDPYFYTTIVFIGTTILGILSK